MVSLNRFNNTEIVIVGLGYVGLPLATHFASKSFCVTGYDISKSKIDELQRGYDPAGILTEQEAEYLADVNFVTDLRVSENNKIYIVTVPTPVSVDKVPDFSPLISASKKIANFLKKKDIVVFESTVYPGATENICIPILEKQSGLKLGADFSVGYSPERVNPGDKERTLDKIIKVVAGSDNETLLLLSDLYSAIVTAGIHKASSLAVAEASKVVENIQRDVNIALMNELQRIFDKIGIDTNEVLDAASTKWNFMNVRPGLVGGHCIGVDPYYLIHRAKAVGENPTIIESARLVNESHVDYVLSKFFKYCLRSKIDLSRASILFYGLAFKPDCEDLRNSKAFSVLKSLEELDINVVSFDPFQKTELPKKASYDLVMRVTKHSNFSEDLKQLVENSNSINIYDLI